MGSRMQPIIDCSIIIIILAFTLMPSHVAFGKDAKFEKGIAITPRNFPHHSPQDLDSAFNLASELGKYSIFIFQWNELDLDAVKLMMEKSRRSNLIPILGLSPTSLDKGRKELDIPATVRKKAGDYVSFENPIIRKEFISSVKNLARMKPPYLCLATEINFLAIQRLDEYLHFVTLYKEAYKEAKKISPDTKIFVSFQWEWVRILDAKEMHKIKEHSKVINIFKPELDLVGLTTYPSAFYDSPIHLPKDYYSWVYNHIERKDSILFMEVGWPTSGTGTEVEQDNFIKRLPELLKTLNTSIVSWALLHDVNLDAFDENLNTVGILTNKGRRKPAFDTFKSLNR